jgi:hypothetical protein
MRLRFECLERRLPMTAEGTSFAIDTSVETTGVLGTVVAVAEWGNGASSLLTVSPTPATGPLTARFDYSYDSTGFFNDPARRQILQASVDLIFSKFSDQLSAIAPSGNNTWNAVFQHPATGQQVSLPNLTINANEILIFPGARDLPGTQAASAGPGGYSWRGTSAWGQTVAGRGQPGATAAAPYDFSPWGGSITVDPSRPWHFGPTAEGLDSNEYDFLSAVSHEIMHILGFGVSDSWKRLVSGTTFTGISAATYNGGIAPTLAGDLAHWREGTISNQHEALMDPSLNGPGIRKLPTELDVYGLADVGWSVIPQTVRVTGSYVYPDNGNFSVKIVVGGTRAGQRTTDFVRADITNVAPTLVQQPDRTFGKDSIFQFVDLGIFQDPAFGPTENFTYQIDWGDGSPLETGQATIDSPGRAGAPTSGSFDGSHFYSQIGSFRVRYRVTDDDGGSDEKSFVVNVPAPAQIGATVDRASIPEDAGPNAANLNISVQGFDLGQPLTLQLSSSDPGEATLASSVTLPAGTTQISVPIEAVDDRLLDGTQAVNFIVRFGDLTSPPVSLEVIDREAVLLALNVASAREDSGAGGAVLRVSRSDTDESNSLVVNLFSSASNLATVPPSVTIPAGNAFLDVSVTVVDDSRVLGTQSVNFGATSNGYANGAASLLILDYEPIQWVSPGIQLAEGDNVGQTVQLQFPAPVGPSDATVTLTVSEDNQVSFPSTVVLPAGQQTVNVSINAVDDALAESTKLVRLTASSQGYESSSLTIVLIDNDRSIWTNSLNAVDVDGSGTVDPIDILLVINFLRRVGTGPLPATRDPLGPPYVDTNGDGILSPLDILLVINTIRRRAASA